MFSRKQFLHQHSANCAFKTVGSKLVVVTERVTLKIEYI